MGDKMTKIKDIQKHTRYPIDAIYDKLLDAGLYSYVAIGKIPDEYVSALILSLYLDITFTNAYRIQNYYKIENYRGHNEYNNKGDDKQRNIHKR